MGSRYVFTPSIESATPADQPSIIQPRLRSESDVCSKALVECCWLGDQRNRSFSMVPVCSSIPLNVIISCLACIQIYSYRKYQDVCKCTSREFAVPISDCSEIFHGTSSLGDAMICLLAELRRSGCGRCRGGRQVAFWSSETTRTKYNLRDEGRKTIHSKHSMYDILTSLGFGF